MSSNIAVSVENISKHYLMFDRPQDRLKQSIVPRLQMAVGVTPTQYYRTFAALNNVSLEVRRGETVGIVGRNGSGKSTLLQIVCGTLQPTSGRIEVNGRVAALLELGAGFDPEFTGSENVFVNGAILGLTRGEMEQRFDSIAAFADIGEFLDKPVKTYSSGMYVRLAFATAINVDPDILVIDEALAVGDEAYQRKCYARIDQIREAGGTILFVSHGAQTIVQLCDRAVLIDRGEKLLEGPPKIVVGQYQRLTYAPAGDAPYIRDEIRRLGAGVPSDNAADDATGINGEREIYQETDADPSCFDPNLMSKTVVSYEQNGAMIRDARILTPQGKQVNVLQSGRSYIYEYHVDFSAVATDIGCGTMLKTVSGIELGGTSSDLAGLNLSVVSDESVRVRFKFQCNLAPGTYFLNAGVGGAVDGSDVMMHRVLDAVMFRVGEHPDLSFSGYVNFNFVPELEHKHSTPGIVLVGRSNSK